MVSVKLFYFFLSILYAFLPLQVHAKSVFQNESERIITDLNVIESEAGVQLDFSYNETKTDIGGLQESFASAPGCPRSIDGVPWVTFGSPPRCYLCGYRGPCDINEVIMLQNKNSNQGVCGCSCLLNVATRGSPLDGKYLYCTTADFVFDSRRESCYELYSKGPCNAGKVLVPIDAKSAFNCVPDGKGHCGNHFYNYETGECQDTQPILPFDISTSRRLSVSDVLPNGCGDSEIYSSVLQKCLQKGGDGLVVG